MNKEEDKQKRLIKRLISERLGVEPDDINDDDSFKEDLHMDPIVLTDFTLNLAKNGFDVEALDFSEIDSLDDLYQILI